jgi:hypothetical protein
MSEHFMVHDPLRQLVPVVHGPAVDRKPPLAVLVFALLKVVHDLMRQLGKVPAVDEVVRLQEDLAESALADRIVFEVELIEPVETVLMRMHVERVDGEVVRGQVQRLEDLLESELFAVAEDDDILTDWWSSPVRNMQDDRY